MSHQQHTLMHYDPATGIERPYPSHAEQWREWHGRSTAWLCNPWTGNRRDARDVGADPFGHLIMPPGEELAGAPVGQQAESKAFRHEPLTDQFVQLVPDQCDRIVWRGNYYHLPLTGAQATGGTHG